METRWQRAQDEEQESPIVEETSRVRRNIGSKSIALLGDDRT
jgi:hypothetical protein